MKENEMKVVVTGLGVISPVGNSVAEAWENIRNGVSGIGPITKFDASRVDSKVAGEVKNFDIKNYVDFKTSKRMALFTQYAVAASMDAWKDAGLDACESLNKDRVSVMLGCGIGGREVDQEGYFTLFEKGPARLSPMLIPKLIANEAAGNVSILLGTKGPSHTLATACASGTDALGHALDMIRSGRSDVVVSGGTEATITEYCIAGFCSMKALSHSYNDTPQTACRPFDATRDGFIMGEGAAILILESEEHAKARGAKIYAEFAGYGSTSDAYHLTAPDPSAAGAIKAVTLALADAGVKPEEVDYVNAHGTSTKLNDAMETTCMKGAFGDHARKLRMSSTKSMTGHMLGAAGAIEAVFSTLAVHDDFYPPTINYVNPDPECDLDIVPNKGVAAPLNVAISTSLGFGGHNGCVVFKKYQ
ncbi:MAG: beta-ketoacyl-ACP synthase II [Kiritimatiellae bacterium]|nr:beta-ketoacyl-ACP synthase II [Kiritimatiellia bacterium]